MLIAAPLCVREHDFGLHAATHAGAQDPKGREAFEAYVRDTMLNAFPPAHGPLQRLFPNAKGEDGEKQEVELTDAVLLDASDAAFFEFKAVWMNERDPSTAESPELYLEQIRRRYSTSEQSATKDKRVSGVGQLARSLRRLASGEWRARDFALESLRSVYPVLLASARGDAFLRGCGSRRVPRALGRRPIRLRERRHDPWGALPPRRLALGPVRTSSDAACCSADAAE